MKVADLLESRRENWRRLDQMCADLEKRATRSNPAQVIRFAALYRAACADLALADSYHLPPHTVYYLHQLVARAHNQLYRSRTFNFRSWGRELFDALPKRLYRDGCLRLAFCVFWGFFFLSMFLASDLSPVPAFSENLIGEEMLILIEEMHEHSIGEVDLQDTGYGAGRYVQHNTSIGLRCFAAGLLFGVGGLFATVFNAAFLGAVFGHMTTVPQSHNFFQFVTAHGPFELTAIVLSAAAGMRLGFALVHTRGLARIDSLRKASGQAMPAMGAAMVLFFLAAMIEGFLSPTATPYVIKAFVAVFSCGSLLFYFIILGYPRKDDGAAAG